MSDLNQWIHVNEQSSGIMRDYMASMSIDELISESMYAWARMILLKATGNTRDAMVYCLASCKLLEMVEQKEREANDVEASA